MGTVVADWVAGCWGDCGEKNKKNHLEYFDKMYYKIISEIHVYCKSK